MTTTLSPTSDDVAELLTQLRAKLASLPDPRDLRSDNEKATYFATYNTTQAAISALMNLPQDIARLDERLAECEAQHTQWADGRDELRAKLEAKVLEGATHVSELERRQHYAQHFGERLTTLRQRRDTAMQSLDRHLNTAHELLRAQQAS
jgi:hypothetical protein